MKQSDLTPEQKNLIKKVLLVDFQLSQDCDDDCEGIDETGMCGCPVNGSELIENVADSIRWLSIED